MEEKKDIFIVKKDSKKELFSYDKLIASILKAGIPMEEAKTMSTSIESWVRETAKSGDINSSDLRDKVIEVLSTDFPSEADSYQAFVKA